MKAYRPIVVAAMGLALAMAGSETAAAQELPIVNGKKIVASVQGEPITMDDLERQRPPGATVDRSADLALLNRMIDLRLIVQEARRMELDKLPEIRRMVDSFARVALREELVKRVVKDLRPDREAVEKIFRNSVAEWKVSAVLFEKEEHASSMVADLKAGGDFGALAADYLAQGKAGKVEDGAFLKRQAMDPAIAQAIETLAVGSTSPVISMKSGFVVLKLEDIRYPEDTAARAAAEQNVLTAARKEAVRAFEQALKKKYAKVDQALVKSLDYESEKPGIEALLKDRRVLAEIKGETPVTVADMTEALKFQFFHGVAQAAEQKKLNVKKEEILDGLLHRKLFRKEALRLKLERTDSYKREVREYEDAALFEALARKAIAPDVKLEEADVRAYYDDHRREYTSPEMMRIRSLVFADAASAESVAAALQKGADFQWVTDHADAQLAPTTEGVLSFDGRPIMTTELPEGVQKAVAGARSGDTRLYASPEKHFYVFSIEQVVEATPQPFEEVRREIAEKVAAAKLRQTVEAYAEKLRALSDVKIYLRGS